MAAALMLAFFTARAQYDNEGLKEIIAVDSADDHWIKLHITDNNFLKNNEYFSAQMVGQTYFGTMLHPSLTWNPNRLMRLQAGVFLRDDFGNPAFAQVLPTFTMKLQKNGYAFLFGTLEGTVNHGYIQPLYEFERYMSDHIENGVQFTATNKFGTADVYLAWEHHQYAGIPHDRETLNTGAVLTPVLFGNERWKISLPLQGIIVHHGGQLDTYVLPHDVSLFNSATGIRASYFPPQGIVKEVRAENYLVYYQELGHHTLTQLFTAGHGEYAALTVKTKYHVDALLTYWYAHDFMSGYGGYLYQSVSQRDPTYMEPFRKLTFLSIMYDQQWLPGLTIAARFEPYYDFFNAHAEYSYSFYATYHVEFGLKKYVSTKD